jgi:selenocysteine lyase/cysteine desulfurase
MLKIDKSEFPASKKCTYLNAASVALMTKKAGDAMVDWNRDLALNGTINFDEEAEVKVYDDLRKATANLFNTSKKNIAVASSATEFLCSLAWALSPGKGENIVTTDVEFPTVTFPWLRLAKRSGAEIRMIKGEFGAIKPEELIDSIDSNTRIVVISHVEYASGERFDIRKIADRAHECNAYLIVDASQSAGAVPIDANEMDVDAIVCTGYKWLCGPFGAAVLYAHPRIHEVEPGLVGWRSTKDIWGFRADQIDYPTDASRFEFSTINYGAAVALARSIEYLLDIGIDKIYEHTTSLSDVLIKEFVAMGAYVSDYPNGLKSPIVLVSFKKYDNYKIAEWLNNNNIIVSPRMKCVRFSPHPYNDYNDIEKAIEMTKQVISQ